MRKTDLHLTAKAAPNPMTKPSRDEEGSVAMLNRICGIPGANIGDVTDFVPDEENN